MRFTYRFYRFVLLCIIRICFRWSARGAECIPRRGPFILVSNHASYLDPVLAGCASRREIHFLARDSLFRFPLVGRLLRSANALPVDRSGRSPRGLKSVLGCLAEGKPVMLFPEGTRSPDGSLQPARSGAGLVAVRSCAPVVPCRIFGSYRAWNRHRRLPRFCRITVVFGEPLEEFWKGDGRDAYIDASRRIMEAIASIEPPPGRERGLIRR